MASSIVGSNWNGLPILGCHKLYLGILLQSWTFKFPKIKRFSHAITTKGNLWSMLAASLEISCLPNNLLVPHRMESGIETVEQIVEVVEKVAEEVDKIAEDIADDLPEGKLKNIADFVEDVAEKTAKNADSVEHFIDKVQEVEDKVESFIESLNGEPKKSPKHAKNF